MPVNNYFCAPCADGMIPLDDGSPELASAIEHWLSEHPGREGLSVSIGELAEPAATLLVLRGEGPVDGVAGSEDPGELVHVVAVHDRRLAETPTETLRELFETLYGAELQHGVPALRVELARLGEDSAAREVLRRFATPQQVEALPWSDAVAQRRAGVPIDWSTLARTLAPALPTAALGAAAMLLGVAVAPLLSAYLGSLGRSDVDATRVIERLEALEQRIAALSTQLRDDAADHQLELALIGRSLRPALPARRSELAPAASGERRPAAVTQRPRPAPAAAPAARVEQPLAGPVPAPATTPVSAATPPSDLSADLPGVAAAPPGSQLFRVSVDTARVRAGPSSLTPTLALLGEDTPVVARAAQGEWIEIDPPADVDPPAWIHVSLVQEIVELR